MRLEIRDARQRDTPALLGWLVGLEVPKEGDYPAAPREEWRPGDRGDPGRYGRAGAPEGSAAP
jgi:hypothetical protein